MDFESELFIKLKSVPRLPKSIHINLDIIGLLKCSNCLYIILNLMDQFLGQEFRIKKVSFLIKIFSSSINIPGIGHRYNSLHLWLLIQCYVLHSHGSSKRKSNQINIWVWKFLTNIINNRANLFVNFSEIIYRLSCFQFDLTSSRIEYQDSESLFPQFLSLFS